MSDLARASIAQRLSRRSLLAAAAAGAGLTALPRRVAATLADSSHVGAVPAPQAVQLPAPWTRYQGAVQDDPACVSFQRGGMFAGDQGNLLVPKLTEHLQSHDLLCWSAPHPSFYQYETLAYFLNIVRATNGRWWRDSSSNWVNDLISVHAWTPHKVVGMETGNEINHVGFRNKFALWAAEEGLPFPHPRSNYRDGAIEHGRDHIGYYVEYILAPAVEGAIWANGAFPAELRIPIVLATLVGARHPRLRDVFLPALLEYQIQGAFAPSLAGKRVKQVIDYIALNYLLTPEVIWGYDKPDGSPLPYGYKLALNDLHSRWVGNGSIKGIWHTEEGGNAMHREEQLGTTALRTFARLTSWATEKNKTPKQTRIIGYYAGGAEGLPDPRWQTSWTWALGVVRSIIGNTVRPLNRSSATFAYADGPLETYGFETADHTRRVLITTPQSATFQGQTKIGWMGSRFDGWNTLGRDITAVGHLFKADAEGYRNFSLDVVRNESTGLYDIYLPTPAIALNANQERRVLMIALDRS